MGKPSGVDVCITFDTTGSMYPCLTQVRRKVEETARRLFRDIPNLRLAVIAHGDYCDAGSTYVTKKFDFSSDIEAISRFIKTVGATGGGDAPECYELVLHEARSLKWQAGNLKALVLIGDDVPHEVIYHLNTKKINWRNELDLLLEAGIRVYGVHAMPGIRTHSKRFYEEIARKTKGYYLTLDQFAAITDILLAVCYQQGGGAKLEEFQQEVQRGKRMSRNMASVFRTLGCTSVEVADRDGLEAVPPGRFQVMDIDSNQSIKDFVEAQGLTFKKGRGFYEFMKTETIQETKEVVLMDKATGDMYSGDTARDMIGLPAGTRGRLKPTTLDQYAVFVQSTSYNRKLIGGTRFLYEVQDA
jgi:hypothetical protein